MRRTVLLALTAVSLAVGIGAATYLVLLKVRHEVDGQVHSETCSAVSATGCTIALESPASTIGPLPVSLVALCTYVLLVGLLALAWAGYLESWSLAVIHLVALGAVLASLALAGYSLSQSSWCPFCIGMYGVNLAVLVLSWVLGRAGPLAALRTVFGRRGAVAATLVVYAVALGGGFMLYRRGVAQAAELLETLDLARLEAAWGTGVQPMQLDGTPAEGPADAAHVLVKFSDFQCPFCKKLFLNVEQLRARWPGKLRIHFRHFPLSAGCNPAFGGDLHPRACDAAKAAVCAQEQGRFWEMARQLFEHAPSFADADLARYAREAGVPDLADWQRCVASARPLAVIRRDAVYGVAAGVEGTPASVVNGFFLSGALPLASLERVLPALERRRTRLGPAKPSKATAVAQAALRAGHRDVAPSPRALPGEADAPFQVVAIIDPAMPRSRDMLKYLAGVRFDTPDLARISLRFAPKTPCAKDASSDACRFARILACSARGPHLDHVARVVGYLQARDPAAVLALLKEQTGRMKELAAIPACVEAGAADDTLAEDAAALAALGPDAAPPAIFVNGYRVAEVESRQQLEQVMGLIATLSAAHP